MCPPLQYNKYPVPSLTVVTEGRAWRLLLEEDIHSHPPTNIGSVCCNKDAITIIYSTNNSHTS